MFVKYGIILFLLKQSNQILNYRHLLEKNKYITMFQDQGGTIKHRER
jgi:hypothetical protein